jgi:hypothetical protein
LSKFFSSPLFQGEKNHPEILKFYPLPLNKRIFLLEENLPPSDPHPKNVEIIRDENKENRKKPRI